MEEEQSETDEFMLSELRLSHVELRPVLASKGQTSPTG
jgi:hypothetical protein